MALNVRIAIACLLALVAVAIAIVELNGHTINPPQCDRETPQFWVHHGPVRWALENGLALGCGALNRIGFWLWYAIPAGAFLVANPLLGGLIYGTYGVSRGISVWLIMYGLARWRHDDWAQWLLGQKDMARTILSLQLLLIGVTVSIVIGL
jgi:hypothetical protein